MMARFTAKQNRETIELLSIECCHECTSCTLQRNRPRNEDKSPDEAESVRKHRFVSIVIPGRLQVGTVWP
jgi:hypothetical protein